jgi:hypothetical protein
MIIHSEPLFEAAKPDERPSSARKGGYLRGKIPLRWLFGYFLATQKVTGDERTAKVNEYVNQQGVEPLRHLLMERGLTLLKKSHLTELVVTIRDQFPMGKGQ